MSDPTLDSTLIVAFSVGLLAVCLLAKLIKLPVELFMKFVSNSVVGALMLVIINFLGLEIEITIIKALFCGITGIPGVIIVILCHYFM